MSHEADSISLSYRIVSDVRRAETAGVSGIIHGIDNALEHGDTAGNRGTVSPGGAQWILGSLDGAASPITTGKLAQPEHLAVTAGDAGAEFLVGTAVASPHPLVLGGGSIHTSREAMAHGRAQLQALGRELAARGEPEVAR